MGKRTSSILGILQIFVAVMAIPAGLSMMSTPDGSGIGIPLSILSNSPFDDFLIPGLFLCFVIGCINAIGAVLTFKRSHYAANLGIMLGIVMMTWIVIQVYFTGFISFLQPMFLVIGIIEILLGKKLLKNIIINP